MAVFLRVLFSSVSSLRGIDATLLTALLLPIVLESLGKLCRIDSIFRSVAAVSVHNASKHFLCALGLRTDVK